MSAIFFGALLLQCKPDNRLVPTIARANKEITMLHTVEALLSPDGELRFLEPVQLTGQQRVLVTFTQPHDEAASGAVLSEPSLAVDWLRPEEDEAWAHLQPAPLVS